MNNQTSFYVLTSGKQRESHMQKIIKTIAESLIQFKSLKDICNNILDYFLIPQETTKPTPILSEWGWFGCKLYFRNKKC